MEYRLRWVTGVGSLRWACTFHALGDVNLTRRQPVFWWNMGFTVNVDIFTQYLFSRISHMVFDAGKYDVSENVNHHRLKGNKYKIEQRDNIYVHRVYLLCLHLQIKFTYTQNQNMY